MPAAAATAALLPTLIVYAYTSFTSSWGAGPSIAKKFEETCKCRVQLVDGGDGGALLARLKLEGPKTDADVVVGFDSATVPKVKKDLSWPASSFVAFDEGPYAFVYDSKETSTPPQSLDGLLDPKWKGQILLEDPRLSTTGLGFLLWVIKEKGDGAWEYLKKLKPQVKVVTPSWDLAYGLFKKHQGQLVFSYWTSPAYHIQEEKYAGIKAAKFTGGHYVQTEFAASVPGAKNERLKKSFVEFLLSPAAQEYIPLRNFMYPINTKAKLTPAFHMIGKVKKLEPLSEKELEKLDEWLKHWREIFS